MKTRSFTQLLTVVLLFLSTILLKPGFSSLASKNGTTAIFLPLLNTSRPVTKIVTVSSNGEQANERISSIPAISGNGRYIAFSSWATNLVTNDTNGHPDIFVHDIQTRQTTRVSVTSGGAQVRGFSHSPTLSSDGRYVAFVSNSYDLVPGDTNFVVPDVFVHDRQTGETTMVSIASDGTQGNSASGDTSSPAISSDGRYVAFNSMANNLVPNDNNNSRDIFVHDRHTGQTTRVSLASNGAEANGSSNIPSISTDGRYVSFASAATNLASNDSNNESDVFVHDRQTGVTTLISIATNGTPANGSSLVSSISANGRYVAFDSSATNLVPGPPSYLMGRIFLRDRETNQTTQITIRWDGLPPGYSSNSPVISGDGRFIAFQSLERDLIPNNNPAQGWNIYLYDRILGKMSIVSVGMNLQWANEGSWNPTISTNGQFLAFASEASNLVPGDINNQADIFWNARIYAGGIP